MALDHRRVAGRGSVTAARQAHLAARGVRAAPRDLHPVAPAARVEALAGRRLHTQNFRRLVEPGGLVEGTGRLGDDGRAARRAVPLPAGVRDRAANIPASACEQDRRSRSYAPREQSSKETDASHASDHSLRRPADTGGAGRLQPVLDDIERLKRDRNAVVAAHNYMTPDDLPRRRRLRRRLPGPGPEAASTADAEVIVQAGVHFMAETAKILSPRQDRADPRPARRLLAGRRRSPAPTCGCSSSASRRAGGHLRQHHRRREGRDRHLLHLGQRRAGGRSRLGRRQGDPAPRPVPRPQRGAPDRRRIIAWKGRARCTSASPAPTSATLQRGRARTRQVLAHPECPPDVLAEADFAGSTAAMATWRGEAPARAGGAGHRVLDGRQRRAGRARAPSSCGPATCART